MRAPLLARISSGFGERIHPISKIKSFHNGVDLAAPLGTSIIAPEAGTIIAYWNDAKGGQCLAMLSITGKRYGFAHLSNRHVKLNEKVGEGQVIANVGSTGMSTGPHLHFTVKIGGTWVNPSNYFKFS
jgi:murein DD-endopeptidase MepM/ murein hydrolase activator NlpD